MKVVYCVLGIVFMIIGGIGAVLPILPTTPFLLLAGICFAKSSDKFHNWFISTKLYKENLETFTKERAMTKKTKYYILGFATSMIVVAMIFVNCIYFRTTMIVLLLFKYYYFLVKVKTIEKQVLCS